MKVEGYDYIVIGAGIYGLYMASKFSEKYPQKKICILEYDSKIFSRASYINQARVHNGYHYPRSLSTALKSSNYYNRFIKDYSFAINNRFKKIYAISSSFSYASSNNFQDFCKASEIPCEPIHVSKYFKKNVVEAAFLTEEVSMDSLEISKYFLSIIEKNKNVDIIYNSRITSVDNKNGDYYLKLYDKEIHSPFVLNSTYASVNQILNLFNFSLFKVKYELAEIALCNVSTEIKDTGITIMDGPFFSVMPFGKSDLHSLSAVDYTPHKSSHDNLPNFDCQDKNTTCTKFTLDNCNTCQNKPKSAFSKMNQLASKYLRSDFDISYVKSLFAIKPILASSEVSDSRPTIIKEFSNNPTFISVLSGKFNTMYDLDEVLNKY